MLPEDNGEDRPAGDAAQRATESADAERCTALLDGLLAAEDVSDEVGRRRAYRHCLAHAREAMEDDPAVNLFLALAAECTGQARAHLSVVQGMVRLAGGARLCLTYSDEGGPALVGNADGLRYLSDLAATLADAHMLGEHVHLNPDEGATTAYSYPLTLSLTDDAWFERLAQEAESEEEGEAEEDGAEDPQDAVPVRREIEPADVAALCFLLHSGEGPGALPPMLPLSPGRLYRVRAIRPHEAGERAWAKYPGGLDEEEAAPRMTLFTLRDDDHEQFEIALHLDDPDLHYFTRRDLEQIWRE